MVELILQLQLKCLNVNWGGGGTLTLNQKSTASLNCSLPKLYQGKTLKLSYDKSLISVHFDQIKERKDAKGLKVILPKKAEFSTPVHLTGLKLGDVKLQSKLLSKSFHWDFKVIATAIQTPSNPSSTPGVLSKPSTPTHLAVVQKANSETEATLTWNAPQGSTVTNYKIYRRTGLSSFSLATTTNSSTTTFTDTGLTKKGTYDYAISASNSAGESAQSSSVRLILKSFAWEQATASAAWSLRIQSTSVVFNNKMWVMGGQANPSYLNDVYSSSDGSTWIRQTSSATWSARNGHTSVVF